uniref:LITAF domain-containing protein n=1 Tax=Acanthochromis polyacanthus TaxID=80966 RepID=A0A3Q1F4G2_9TELE
MELYFSLIIFIHHSFHFCVVHAFLSAAMVGALADGPVQTVCPKCHQSVLSKYNILTLAAVLSSFVLGCCLVPFCVNRLKDATHICPSCKTVLGVYKRL